MDELPSDKVIRSAVVKRNLLGLPGLPLRVVVRRLSPEPDQPNKAEEPPVIREFSVTFTLSRPGEAITPDGRLWNAGLLRGNSHLRLRMSDVPPTPETPEVKFSLLTTDGLFQIQESVNSEGFICKLEVRPVKAVNFSQAEEIARRLVTPSISWHSAHVDIPLNIYQVDVVDLKTDDFMIYRDAKPFDPFVLPNGIRIFDIKKESGAYASLYREALNSNSHSYQFLCLYKIIEGIRNRRNRLSKEALANKQSPVQLSEKIPASISEILELLARVFFVTFEWDSPAALVVIPEKFWGRKVSAVVDTELRPIRNDLAHAFLDSGEIPLSLDEFANHARVTTSLPMTKCFARWMLKNEFPDQFLSH